MHVHIIVYACMYACMHVCMYECMHVCMYACIDDVYIHTIIMYIYICILVCTTIVASYAPMSGQLTSLSTETASPVHRVPQALQDPSRHLATTCIEQFGVGIAMGFHGICWYTYPSEKNMKSVQDSWDYEIPS